jgi:Ser/Thr protein kinase RdoA (MazF antagonist)
MPELAFVTQILRELYALEPQSVELLDRFQVDRRAIYRVQDAQHGAWVLRMKHVDEAEPLTDTARVLHRLAEQRYPAPRVRQTSDQQFVGVVDGWAVQLLSYVEGAVLGTDPAELALLARTLGRLHTLADDTPATLNASRCHPDAVAHAAQQLATYQARIPHAFRALASDLHTSMLALLRHAQEPLAVTHGDCWYMNAIKTSDGDVVLIDWDNAGAGLPLLELGNLLLTSHFELSRPLVLEPSEARIRAIMQGYQQHCSIGQQHQERLTEAMRFLLAFQLGSYAADDTRVTHPDFPFVLQKLQARASATRPIAEIAAQYL